MTFLVLSMALAAKPDGPKQPWFTAGSATAPDIVTVEVREAFLNKKEAVFKLALVNHTDSFLKFDMTETVAALGTDFRGEREILVMPGARKNRNLRYEGKDVYTLTPKVSFGAVQHAKPITEPAGSVPVRNANLEVGAIKCKADKSVGQNAKFTDITFRCTNAGSNVGVLNPESISMVTENGTSFGNLSEVRAALIKPGKSREFKLSYEARRPLLDAHGKKDGDLQLASATLDFSKALHEAEWVPVSVPTLELTYDEKLTEAKR